MRMLQGVKPWAFFAPGMACSVVALSTVAAGDPHASDPLVWAAWTASPTLITEPTGARDAELLAHCGAGEAGLREAAKRVVRERITEGAHLDVDRLEMTLRASGEPHVWPRAWVVSGRALDRDATLAKLDAWRASFRDDGERRCGIASATTSDGTEFIAAVALDALADLAPLPLRTHIGTWLTVDATMLASARGAHVVIQGPEADSHRPTPNAPNDFPGQCIEKLAKDRAHEFEGISPVPPFRDQLGQPSHPLPGNSSLAFRCRRQRRIKQHDKPDVLARAFELSRHLVGDHPAGAHPTQEIWPVRLLSAYGIKIIRCHILDTRMCERNIPKLPRFDAENSEPLRQPAGDVSIKQGLAIAVMNKEKILQTSGPQFNQRFLLLTLRASVRTVECSKIVVSGNLTPKRWVIRAKRRAAANEVPPAAV